MTPEQLHDTIIEEAATAARRVLTVGAEQYHAPGEPQRFETMPLAELLAYMREEWQDAINYAAMGIVRVKRIAEALVATEADLTRRLRVAGCGKENAAAMAGAIAQTLPPPRDEPVAVDGAEAPASSGTSTAIHVDDWHRAITERIMLVGKVPRKTASLHASAAVAVMGAAARGESLDLGPEPAWRDVASTMPVDVLARRIHEWSEGPFPNATRESTAAHLIEEVLEVYGASEEDVSAVHAVLTALGLPDMPSTPNAWLAGGMADVIVLALQLASRCGFSVASIVADKMDELAGETWSDYTPAPGAVGYQKRVR